jgi:hypothetical protein
VNIYQAAVFTGLNLLIYFSSCIVSEASWIDLVMKEIFLEAVMQVVG